ncbi:MAG TPA: helix-turn-helix domain-containing protein [Azospirillaceae bacterium]|nr:helix-turn-helix domain-containing protein [Azospirillaceae bacterium]
MARSPGLTIGALAGRTGSNVPTIRYYEQIGLLPKADRKPGGHRTYGDDALRRLAFIRRCRDFGFSIEQVRALVALVDDPGRNCFEARDLAQAHLDTVRRKLAELRDLERSLARFVEACTIACAGGPGPDCTILEDLASPAAGPARLTSTCCG